MHVFWLECGVKSVQEILLVWELWLRLILWTVYGFGFDLELQTCLYLGTYLVAGFELVLSVEYVLSLDQFSGSGVRANVMAGVRARFSYEIQ